MSAHALLAPSKAARWLNCAGSIAAEQAANIEDTGSSFAREGTAAHLLGERALQYGEKAEFWKGEIIEVPYTEDGVTKLDKFKVDDEMVDNVQVYVDQVLREPGQLLVEQVVDLSPVFGVKEQFGTADAVVINTEAKNLYVGDLKYGRGVMVYAKDNDQLYAYAAGVCNEHSLLHIFDTITVAIHQPRLNHYDQHTLTIAELQEWCAKAKFAAQVAVELVGTDAANIENHKAAGDKQCQWCPIKGSCNTLAKWAHKQVYSDFTSLTAEPTEVRDTVSMDGTTLGLMLQRENTISGWLKAVRAEAVKRAEAIPGSVVGWKMVPGKKGARKWSDEAKAEKIMKGSRIKAADMYTKKLLTLPAAEKAFKKTKPKVWTKLNALMEQKDGAPSIAPESDPRPALVIAEAEQFTDVSEDFSDLLG